MDSQFDLYSKLLLFNIVDVSYGAPLGFLMILLLKFSC